MEVSHLDVREKEDFPRPPEELQEKIGITFEDPSKLRAALTHPSFWGNYAIPESERLARSYERLEFLGDSVIALAVCTYLFKAYPDDNQGILSKVKAHVVSKHVLLKAAQRLELGDYLRVGKGVEETAGRDHAAFMVDCFESLVGAVYLDRGFEIASDFVLDNMKEFLDELPESGTQDFKTALQETVQKEFKALPKYRLVGESGPDHRKVFAVEVYVNGEMYGAGEGHSKKEAEIAAAEQALRKLGTM